MDRVSDAELVTNVIAASVVFVVRVSSLLINTSDTAASAADTDRVSLLVL